MGKGQSDTIFVFDEPTIGLHPLDVIKNVDYVVDMEPDGGVHGGEIVAAATPEEICRCENSKTGVYLKQYLEHQQR